MADRSKSHTPEHLITQTKTLAPRATVVRISEATHHSLPAAHSEELSAALEQHLA